ncbi:hypothetical protein CPB86DRAFT_737923 [Serendipita vermifera]|nr:hypothetical protein CPB86DRAFT_737923 [Serendipita vermifera]
MVASVTGMEEVLPFLKAYPFPAWVCAAITGHRASTGFVLEPIWSNPPFDALLSSPSALVTAMGDIGAFVSFGAWLESTQDDQTTYTLTLKVGWEHDELPEGVIETTVELELARTKVVDAKGQTFAVVTSTSKRPLPKTLKDTAQPREPPRKRRRIIGKLENLPSFRSSISNHSSSGSSPTNSITAIDRRTPRALEGHSMFEMIEAFPWETTSLGPKASWDPCLRQASQLILTYPYPAALWWGDELVTFYNDPYSVMLTTKHPRIFGQAGMEAWGEIWDTLGPALTVCMKGIPVFKQDDLLFMDRLESETQRLEETYHTWSWVPILGQDGKFAGIFNTTVETSSKVIAERRMSTLQTLGNRASTAPNRESFCQATLSSLEENDKDIPFALLYLMDSESHTGEASQRIGEVGYGVTQICLRLRGVIGVPDKNPYAPETFSFTFSPLGTTSSTSSLERFCWPFEQATHERTFVPFPVLPEVAKSFERRSWGDPTTHAVIMPLSSDLDSKPLGFLIMGLNTRRNFDADYRSWISLLKSALDSYLTGSIAREEEVKRANYLAELDAAKTALFSNASHELRTPLTLIAGPVNDIINITTDPLIRSKLSTASRNIDRLTRLVDSLMDFSRLEAGKVEGRYIPVQFGSFVAERARVFQPIIEKGSLKFNIIYDEEETRQLFIDVDYMEKIIFNVIGNAFKYTMEGGIEVEVVYTDKDASLIVRDTGVGIPETDLPRIWERFHRVEATSRSHEGTGIGLSLTKQFVELHGGRISVKSVVPTLHSTDHGSEFKATFPLGKDHLPAARCFEDICFPQKKNYARGIVAEAARWALPGHPTPSTDSEEFSSGSDPQRMADLALESSDLILLADDNQDMLEYIRDIFSKYCRVKTASNGRIALELARKHSPHLIISDVMMPALDGFGLVNSIKEDPMLESTPIILLSARAADANRAEGMLSGADDYVSKPFSSRELLARASFHIQLGKRRREMEAKFKERTKEMQILSDLSPSGLFRLDIKGQMAQCNNRFRELAGMREGEENNWLEFVHVDYRSRVQSTLREALEKESLTQVDFVFSNGNWVKGHVRWWPLGLVGTVTDMSLTRLYEDSLKKRAKEAEERRIEAEERRKGQELLVDVTSHELRQPVSAVINCANLVYKNLNKLREKLGECAKVKRGFMVDDELLSQLDEDLESLNGIEICGLAQGHIVNDILTLSRMQLHMLALQDSVFPLVREVRQVCSIFINEMRIKGITHSLTFGPSVQTLAVKYVSGDKIRFGQVITNLLSNAIRFSQLSERKVIDIAVDVSRHPPDSEVGCLKPEGKEKDLVPFAEGELSPVYIYVSVHDSGPGLKPEDLEILFQRFQKGTNSEETFGGSGLGLFVSRHVYLKICDLLGGRIEVDPNSVKQTGSIFNFFVQMSTARPPLQLAASARNSTTVYEGAPLRILVAEDNQINRTILIRQLKANNCIAVEAINGAEAVELAVKAGDATFDCILMDCEMPVMSGFDATKELRRLESLGQIPPQRIIALTGNARKEQLENAINAGMDEVMTKPYRLPELLERIRIHQT